jgi:hypothetical protein
MYACGSCETRQRGGPGSLCGCGLGASGFSTVVAPAIDIQTVIRELNTIKPVTYQAAGVILARGQQAIDRAIELAKSPLVNRIFGVKPAEATQKKRQGVWWKLKWHADRIAEQHGGPPKDIYPYAADLKNWATQAFVEYNSAAEFDAQQGAIAAQFWQDVWQNFKDLPKAITGLSGWQIFGIIVGAVAVLLAGLYMINKAGATSVTVTRGMGAARKRRKRRGRMLR